MEETTRFNLRLPKEINEWYKKRAAVSFGVKKAKEAYMQKVLIEHYKRSNKNG